MFTAKQFTKALETKKHGKRLPVFMLAGACEWGKREVVEQIAEFRGVALSDVQTLWHPKNAQLSNELFIDADTAGERLLVVRGDVGESEVVLRFVKSPTRGLTVVLWLPATWRKSRGKLFAAMEQAAWVIICRQMRRATLTKWAEKWLSERGIVFADSRALQVLLDRSGPDRRMVVSELEKLALYVKHSGRELVSFKDVERCVFDHQSDDILDFLIAVSARNKVRALQLLSQLWSPGSGSGHGLMSVLVRRLKQIKEVHAMLSDRPTVQDVAEKLRVSYYFVPSLLAAARNFTRAEIEDFMAELVTVGRKLFTADGRFLFEQAVLKL